MTDHAGLWGPDNIVFGRGSTPVVDKPFRVLVAGTDTLAQLYTDRDRTDTASNPGSTGPLGNVSFYADPGYYDLVVGETTLTVLVPLDPADGDPGVVLSDATPQAPGAAGPGVSVEASRADHRHAPPTAGQIGAATPADIEAAIDALPGPPTAVLAVADLDMSGGSWTVLPGLGVPRMFLVGLPVLILSGADRGLWTVTASGPCTPLPDPGGAVIAVTAQRTVASPILDDQTGQPAGWVLGPTAETVTALGSTVTALGSDPRLSDARTPTAHKTSHQSGGSDELTLAQSQVTNLTTDLAAKVPKSLVDAKGDLIAATADDTPARLAVGADGLPVIADSAQSIGLAYGVPSTGSGHYRDNEHYLLSRTGGRLGSAAGYAPGADKVVTWDIEILEPVKLDGEWFYVQTANTGAKMRVGIYAKSTTTGHPTGNPLVTCTEIDASTLSYKTDTFTKTGWIMPGLYAGLLATNDGTAGYRAPAFAPTAGAPACDLGRGTGTVTPYMSWIASWTYSSSALPDVSAFTWTASTTIPAPFVAWKVRRS